MSDVELESGVDSDNENFDFGRQDQVRRFSSTRRFVKLSFFEGLEESKVEENFDRVN